MGHHQQRTALLIIDMINDFQFRHGKTLAQQSKRIAENILLIKQAAKSNGIPMIYVNDHYNLWRANIDSIVSHCLNEVSRDVIQSMEPEKDDYFLIKPKHSGFYGTALNTLLRQLDVNHLILTGIAGNICVLFTANDAYMREYELTIPYDCTASNNKEDNDYALRMMKNVLKATICSTHKLIGNFSPAEALHGSIDHSQSQQLFPH